jgi:hypothetical protein
MSRPPGQQSIKRMSSPPLRVLAVLSKFFCKQKPVKPKSLCKLSASLTAGVSIPAMYSLEL